ncbi:IS256 family transposase [Mycobacterium sp.]|uniref:IS256 family transposase n=1 Tax=Mycobacterium sp. TaxID=1785 RepID=UPI00262A9A4A|nr:IS256 family transposase [Mycobacterium sp.]
MPSRVSPTEKIRDEIDALFGSGRELSEVLEDVARLGARLIMQAAVEAEVEQFLGRARYQRREQVPDARPGSRNGYCPSTVKTTAGPVTVARPKLRGAGEKFVSRLFGTGVSKTNALETLVIAGFVRGLSVRDVEAALADALGPQAALSKSTVSRVCQAIRDEFDAWRTRRLDEVELDYLFVDGSHFKMHAGSRAEPVLAAWGITTAGKPVLVGLEAAANEGNDAWDNFLDELKSRGLRPPLLVISDGAAGLVGAIERTMARSLRQRCLIHRCRNVLAKVPARAQAEVKAAYWTIFDVPADIEPGENAEAVVQQRIRAFAATYQTAFPAAVRCLQQDQRALTAYLRFPREHWHRIRHSNFIERTFGETRRRVKVIGRLPGETSCVSLVWAVLDRASRGWRGFTITTTGTRLLQDLRRQLLDPPTPIRRHAKDIRQPAADAA